MSRVISMNAFAACTKTIMRAAGTGIAGGGEGAGDGVMTMGKSAQMGMMMRAADAAAGRRNSSSSSSSSSSSVKAAPTAPTQSENVIGADGRFSRIDVHMSPSCATEIPSLDGRVFGRIFTDHMVHAEWRLSEADGARLVDPSLNEEDSEALVMRGWRVPELKSFGDVSIHPASQCLHYGSEVFEGMKAFRSDVDGETVHLFRPELNARRLRISTKALGLPYLPDTGMLQLVEEAVRVDKRWVPHDPGCSLYIRPFVFGTSASVGLSTTLSASYMVLMSPVGRYFKDGLKPVALLLDDQCVRAWPGGIGFAKAGGNYAPTLKYQGDAMRSFGCSQVLYALPRGESTDDAVLSEAGAMNIFVFITRQDGTRELVTAPLDGTILSGVTRQSVIDICNEWGEFEVSERAMTVGELKQCAREGRLHEMFGCGTAVLICPVNVIKMRDGTELTCTFDEDDDSLVSNRVRKRIEDIQYGRVPGHPWAVKLE